MRVEYRLNGTNYQLQKSTWVNGGIAVGEAIAQKLDNRFLQEDFSDLSRNEVDKLVKDAENAGRYLFEERLLDKAIEDAIRANDYVRGVWYLSTRIAIMRKQERSAEVPKFLNGWLEHHPLPLENERELKAAYVSAGAAAVDVSDYDLALHYADKAEEAIGYVDKYIFELRAKVQRELQD